MKRTLSLATAALLGASALSAQNAADARACGVDPKAPWYVKQLEWLDESKKDWTNDTLRTKLLTAAATDSATLRAVQLGVHVSGRGSAVTSTPALDSIVAQLKRSPRGTAYPSRSTVGAAAARVVGLGALRDTSFTFVATRRMQEAGPAESFAADVAVLEDRARLGRGRKQLYGTQFALDANGKIVLQPMEDSAHADLRREGAGLPPFKIGLCLANRIK